MGLIISRYEVLNSVQQAAIFLIADSCVFTTNQISLNLFILIYPMQKTCL